MYCGWGEATRLPTDSAFTKYGERVPLECNGAVGAVLGRLRQRTVMTIIVMQKATKPPTAPPTMAPIGIFAGDGVGISRGVAAELGVVVGEANAVTECVVDTVIVHPSGYTVPVLMPLAPVNTGKAIGSV